MILPGENERRDCGGRAFVEVLKQGSWAFWGGKHRRRHGGGERGRWPLRASWSPEWGLVSKGRETGARAPLPSNPSTTLEVSLGPLMGLGPGKPIRKGHTAIP